MTGLRRRREVFWPFAFASFSAALLGWNVAAADQLGDFSVALEDAKVVVSSTNGHKVLSLDPLNFLYQVGDQKATERYGTFEITEGPAALTCTFAKWSEPNTEGAEFKLEGQFKEKGCPEKFHLKLRGHSPTRLLFTWGVPPFSRAVDQQRLSFEIQSTADENFLGLGAQYTHLKLKGHKVPILAQEQGHGRGLQPISFLQSLFTPGLQGTPYSTYAPSSFFLSTMGRAFFFPQYEYGEFDFSKPSAVGIKYWSGEINGEVYLGDAPEKLIGDHTARIGRQKVPPEWSHQGAIIGIMGGTEKVRSLQTELEKRGTPIAAWWLQDWVGVRRATLALRLNWNWQLDEMRYPEWDELVGEMHERGERVLSYVNPYISPDAVARPPQRSLYEEALQRGFLVLNKDKSPYLVEMGGFKACLIDLFNPEAREWLKAVMLEKARRHKISGWMADFGEAFPFDGVVDSEYPEAELHHRYIEEWTKLNHEVEEESASDELFIFQRSGFHLSQRYSSMHWLGDQATTWDGMDGMRSALNGMLSSGLSGWQFNHSDIGGYFSLRIPPLVRISRSAELFLRWAEMNAFTPLFRTHEGLNPDLNFQFYSTPWAYDSFASLARVFADLFPYRKEVFEDSARTGLPAVRHLYLNYPEDPESLNIEDQFLLGSDLLVAPILESTAAQRKVYLPAGSWTHLWSGKSYHFTEGTWIEQYAPIGEPPVYINPKNKILKNIFEKYKAIQSLE